MICGPWRADLDPGVLEVLGRNPFATRWNSRYRWLVRQDPCSYCGGPGGTVDHIVPKMLGGPRWTWTNYTGACRKCNSSHKRAAPLLLWLVDPAAAKKLAFEMRPRFPKTLQKARKALIGRLRHRAWALRKAGQC